jgi:DNA-binding response OmpR family regulator
VILVSGYDSDEKIRRALQMGRVEFLQKPYKINDLALLVRTILQRAVSPSS